MMKLDTKTRAKFLAHLASHGSFVAAAKHIKVSTNALYEWRKRHPEFGEAINEARKQAISDLEVEARRRAITGWLEPVFYQGDECGEVRKYSDKMLDLLLKANKPDKYRDRASIEHSGPGGGPLDMKLEIEFIGKKDGGEDDE